MEEIKLKLTIDGKEANTTIGITDDNLIRMIRRMEQLEGEARSATGQMVTGFNTARVVIQGVKETFDVLSMMFSRPIQAAAQFESFQVQFEVLLGNASEAKARISELSEFAAKTPFQLPEVVDASRQLEVLTKGALATGEGLRMVGDVAAGTGVRINEIAMWFGRLYDNIQSGRPVGEALMRLQELGAVSGETRGELEKLQKENRMQAEGWDIVTKAMERFGGMMDKQSETLGGKLSNLEDNFGKLQVTIGGTIATGLSPLLDEMNSLINMANELSPTLTGVVGTLGMFTSAFITLRVTGILPAISAMKLFGVAVWSMKGALLSSGIGAIIIGLGYGLSELSAAFDKFKSAETGKKMSMDNLAVTRFSIGVEGKSQKDLTKMLEEYRGKINAVMSTDIQNWTDPIMEGTTYENDLLTKEEFVERIKLYISKIEELTEAKKQQAELSEEERKKIFNAQRGMLNESTMHEVKMAEIVEKGDESIFRIKYDGLQKQKALYLSYGEDITEIENRLTELQTERIQQQKRMEIEYREWQNQINQETAAGITAPEDIALDDVKFLAGDELEKMKIDNLTNELDRKKALNDWERDQEYQKFKDYENFSAIKIEIDKKHANTKKQIEGDSMQASLQMMGDLLAEHTAFGKAVAIASATMNTYVGATKALDIGGPFGIPLMATVIAAGMAQVASIMGVEIPKLATGGVVTRPTTALIGEAGPEAIIPLNRYNFSSGELNTRRLENLIEHHVQSIENAFRSIEFRIKSGDLYGIVTKETKRRKSFK